MTTWIIVEDEPDVYQMLLAMSEVLGNEGIAFVNGEEAVAWIEDADHGFFLGELPELALLDIRLPNDVDGPTVGERIRKSPLLGNIAIVLMTAFKLNEEQEKAAVSKAGADLILSKPLPSLAELKRQLDAAVNRRPKLPEPAFLKEAAAIAVPILAPALVATTPFAVSAAPAVSTKPILEVPATSVVSKPPATIPPQINGTATTPSTPTPPAAAPPAKPAVASASSGSSAD